MHDKLLPVTPAGSTSHLPESAKFSGSLSGPMWRKVDRLNSAFPDNFDWSIYDRLHAKFGLAQPRGGVVFKTTLRLVNHHASCSRCHYAFEIDTYGRGCTQNCVYCYALEQLTAHGFWNEPHPFPIDLAELRKQLYTVFETDKRSKWRSVIEQRVPLRIGSMSDSFMWMDLRYGVTRELLRLLSFYNYPYIVFTRSDLIAHEEYLPLLRRDLCSVQLSMSGGNDQLTRSIEPGAPSVARRLIALRKLNEARIWTTARLNPFFPMHPDGYFTDNDSIRERFGSKDASPVFDLFSWDFLDQIKDTGTSSVLAGIVRLSPIAVKNMSKATGIDLKRFFKPENIRGSFDLHYSEAEIGYYYFKLKAECAKRGLRFSTCYIGQDISHYFKFQQLWTNKADCCDARGNVKAIQASSQDIGWDERLRHAAKKLPALQSKEADTRAVSTMTERPSIVGQGISPEAHA